MARLGFRGTRLHPFALSGVWTVLPTGLISRPTVKRRLQIVCVSGQRCTPNLYRAPPGRLAKYNHRKGSHPSEAAVLSCNTQEMPDQRSLIGNILGITRSLCAYFRGSLHRVSGK
jgi:hypothetical protein